jgi:hypothetical protein
MHTPPLQSLSRWHAVEHRPRGAVASHVPSSQSADVEQGPKRFGTLTLAPRSQHTLRSVFGSLTHSLLEWQSASLAQKRPHVEATQAEVPVGQFVAVVVPHMPLRPSDEQNSPAGHSALLAHAWP